MTMTDLDARFSRRLEGLLDQALGILEAALDDPAVPAEKRQALALRLLELGADPVVPPVPVALPVEFVTIPQFLPPELHRDVIAFAASQRGRLQPSRVTTGRLDYRHSQVLDEPVLPELEHRVRTELDAVLPDVFAALGHALFTPAKVELQLTAHGDGAFFKVHSDSGTEETAGRVLTFVIYFQLREPRGYDGGVLRVYQTTLDADGRTGQHRPDVYRDLAPEDNMIVFFDSRLFHEVLPVRVASGAYEDGRFTLNGWLHRSEQQVGARENISLGQL